MTDRPPQRRVFAPVIMAVILVLLGGDMALQLGLTGSRFLPRLNDPHPALARSEPYAGRAQRPRLARSVFVVILDGLRVRESIGLRYLDELRRRGIEATASSHYPSFSRPNYVSIVTGVPPMWSGVRSNQYDEPVALESIMATAGNAGLGSAFVSDLSPGLPRMFTRPVDDAAGAARFVSDFHDMHYVRWPGGFVLAAHLLIERRYPLVVMHLGDVDVAGHEFGADSPEYLAATVSVDQQLQLALANIDLERDAVVVVADHGHTDAGGHGGLEPEVIEVPLILAGAGVRPAAAVSGARLIDIAPTVATLLGVQPPGHGLGRTLTEALILPDETAAAIRAADAERITRNELIVAAARDTGSARVAAKRIWRVPLVLGLFVVGIVLIVAARRVGAVRLDWRVLAITLPAFPVTYYLALGLLEQQFSPSAIPELGDIFTLLLRWGLVSTAAHIVVAWIALRGRVVLRERLAAAAGLTACGLFLSLVPAGLAWALYGGPFVEAPGPSLVVLIPATLVAVAFYAMAAAVTLGLEIVIFFARAVDPRVHLRRLEAAAERQRSVLEEDQ
ncbi:MAG TPA: alkaline phosphatase family protein [Kofleriaceae bacterium]|nr:alkaline phosphatase family protein [Kofleriaceae bacterium]